MDEPDLYLQRDAAESAEERAARLAWERAALEEAERFFEEEGGIPVEDVVAWVDSWGTPHELPPPEPRKDEIWRRMMDARAAEKAEGERS